MYCKAGQATEEEMYNNEFAGPAFEEFLDMLGQRVRLKGFDKYRGGLDTKTDTTGLYSIFNTHQDCEVMFHVSTLLPYTPNNKQQLLRKRHIGNDIVTIVFQEPDALPFTPKNIRSQFQHVFIVVRVVNPCSDNTCYRVAVSRSKEVAPFGPPIPESATFPKSKKFADFLLAKVLNAENAAHRSDKFVTMAQRTRQEYLKELASNHCTNTSTDSGPKFSILSFGGRKKERSRPRFIPDSYVLGAISWQVQVEDFGKSSVVDCLLAISVDTLVVMDETNQDIIFVCPCASILGWSSQTTSLKIFYHQGECLVIRSKDPDVDEIQEIVSRLLCVTNGAETQELILRRNSLGQLGFHVQFEGVITEVENYGFAWQAGLRQGSR
ncbi:Signal-induced proliferation-associated 1-like protein 2, partial [Stegodyphus mimosarum]